MKKQQVSQSGFVSIIVCLLIMIVLSLVTTGFAQIMGREQRQAIDRQLSSQAFYAAESGVNDAVTELRRNPLYEKDSDCDEIEINSVPVTKDLDAATQVRSTCVTVDPSPDRLVYNPVSINAAHPTVVRLIGVDDAGAAQPITSLTIDWSPTTSSLDTSRFTSHSSLVPFSGWDAQTGMLKVSLYRFSNGDTSAAMAANTATVYLNPSAALPTASVSHASITGTGSGQVVNGTCTVLSGNVPRCRMVIDAVTDPSSSGALFLGLSSVYRANNVTVSARSSAVSELNFRGAQVVIDSTGRTGDVLRRIEVRRSVEDTYAYPAGGIVSDGAICKLMSWSPTSTTDTTCGL